MRRASRLEVTQRKSGFRTRGLEGAIGFAPASMPDHVYES